ncbi:hypothetical protein FSP39_019330 [Pinctada imbricata]|uniref:Uncharacterized protein n=1 Tax=Pinctada imbricata TaxID=66713 RepID=A0AA88YFN5_PINIB|nr:hypothetical protein FSP39_019330 [Pinctada imbricata]
MPEIVPDDGARDPIIRREQQPTICTEGNDSTRGTSRVRFDETTHKLAGGPKAFKRSFSEDPSAFYKRNCDSGARPFQDFYTDCDTEGEGDGEGATNKTIETQTSLQETTENEILMHKLDELDCEKCGQDDKHGLRIRRQISIKAERRCKLLTILFFVLVFILIGALLVTFLVLRTRPDDSAPTAQAQTQSNTSESHESKTCPSFVAEIKTDELKNTKMEFALPWRQKQDNIVSYLHMMDRDKLVIQKSSTYTVHANVHIDTKSWAKANDKSPTQPRSV